MQSDAKIWREITLEKTIYGGKPKNPVAYCALHNGSLTVKEMKKEGLSWQEVLSSSEK